MTSTPQPAPTPAPPRRRLIWPVALALLLPAALLAAPGAEATPTAQHTAQHTGPDAATAVVVPASVPAGTPDTAAGRLQAIKRSGIQVVPGSIVTITASGLAVGNPDTEEDWGPGGSSSIAEGPEFANVPGNAPLYSLVGRIDAPGSDGGQTNSGNTWFLVGTQASFTADQAGELVFLFHDALYRDNWVEGYVDNTGSFTAQVEVVPPLTVLTGGPYTTGEGQVLALDGTVSSNVTTTTWSFPRPIGGDLPPCAFTDPAVLDTSVSCADDGEFTMRLTGTDGTRQNRPQTTLTVTNRPPVADALGWTPSTGCSGAVSASFTDPGTSDTHTASVNWGDHSSGPVSVTETGGAGSVQASHTFPGSGSYAVELIVTDDDGGTVAVPRQVVVPRQAGALRGPVNGAGKPRSVFALGSTIRLKLGITDCAGRAATGLAPTVTLTRVSKKAGKVNERFSNAKPTPGTTMVAKGSGYGYSLSTMKGGNARGGALAKGTYRITVSDPSLAAPVSVLVALK